MSRHLIELFLDMGSSARFGETVNISGLSDDVLISILRRSLAAGFGDILASDDIAILARSLECYAPWGHRPELPDKASLCQGIFDMFRGRCTDSNITYREFSSHFRQFIAALKNAVSQAMEPQLMDVPCRGFGELDLGELSNMRAPEELSGYMISLARYFRDIGVITAADADHLGELIEKMTSAPGYLRFLGKEKKYQEIVWLFDLVRQIQQSEIMPDTAMDDMSASLGLLLYNLRPSERVASYLASIRPSPASNALLYHINAILALNHLLTGQLHLATAYAARALRTTSDRSMMAYVYILQGCIAIRQSDYDRGIALLNDAADRAPAGRMSALIAFYRGIIFFEKREFANAIRCFESAGACVSDPIDLVTIHNNAGSCALYLGDLRRAEEEFLKMEQLAWRLNRQLAQKCQLAASSYIGAISRALGDNQKAIERYENALKLAVSSNDGAAIANQMGNLGAAYAKADDHEKALPLLYSCMAYSERMGYWAGIRYAYWHISHILTGNRRWSEARQFSETYTARYPELKDMNL